MKSTRLLLAAISLAAFAAAPALAQDKTLRLLTWADYAPKGVVEQFTKETGYTV